jgi:uncharacterized protein YbbC (DUF1343 family)
MSVLPGIDVLLRRRFAGRQHLDLLVGRRVGLIGNASAVTHDLTSDVDALRRTPDVQLVALFGPEHGFYAVAADGAAVGSTVDSHTRLPVHSLYGEECKPTAETLTGIDVLVFDIQSVGVRFYTYVTTLLYVMQAATEYGVPLVVCDRPNPIGGEVVEGPILERGFESFVGPDCTTKPGKSVWMLRIRAISRWCRVPAGSERCGSTTLACHGCLPLRLCPGQPPRSFTQARA